MAEIKKFFEALNCQPSSWALLSFAVIYCAWARTVWERRFPIPRKVTFIETRFCPIHQNFAVTGCYSQKQALCCKRVFGPMGAKDISQEPNMVRLGLFDGLWPSKSRALRFILLLLWLYAVKNPCFANNSQLQNFWWMWHRFRWIEISRNGVMAIL